VLNPSTSVSGLRLFGVSVLSAGRVRIGKLRIFCDGGLAYTKVKAGLEVELAGRTLRSLFVGNGRGFSCDNFNAEQLSDIGFDASAFPEA